MESKYQYRQRKVELDTVKEFRLVEGHQWLFVFVTPQFNHWHHSSEKPAIDTNYSAHLVFFDWLFGTYHMPKEHWPAE